MNLARLVIAQTLLQASMVGLKMTAPLFALSQGFDAAAAGFVVALFAVSQSLLALPAGRLAGRSGLQGPMCASAIIAATAAAGVAIFPSFLAVCVAACAVGAAMVVALAAIQLHVGRDAESPMQLRRAFGWLSTGSAASNFLGPVAAGWLIDRAGAGAGVLTGYRAAFTLMALLPLMGLLAVPRLDDEAPMASPRQEGTDRAHVARGSQFRRLMAVNCILSACWDIHAFAVPVLGYERGISASTMGAILGAFAVAVAMVRVVTSVLAHRLQERTVLVCAMLAAAVLFGLYPLTSSAAGMCTCSVMLGLVLGMEQPMVMSLLHQVTPAHLQGEAIGIRLLLNNVSSAAAPLLLGAASGMVGLAAGLWAFSGLLALGSKAGWHLGRGADQA